MNEETNQDQVFSMRPEHLIVSEDYNVRRFSGGDAEREIERIERLGKTIEAEGQLNAVLVTKGKDDKGEEVFILISGHKRRRALLFLNEQRTAKNLPRLSIKCKLVDGANIKQLRRKGFLDNIQREDLSAIEVAIEIKALREDNGWEGLKGTKQVASYLGMDPQLVMEYEKLLSASKDIQEAVHEGTLSIQNALTMLDVNPAKESEVLERAKQLQIEKDKTLTSRAKRYRKAKGVGDGETIERPALVKAIRETPGASDKPLARTRKDILDTLEQFDSPLYGHPDGAARVWLRYLIDKYAPGEGTVATLRQRWEAMVAKAPKGTKQEPEPIKEAPVKAVAKKKPAKKAAKKKAAKKKIAAKKAPAKKTLKPKAKSKPKAKAPAKKPNGSSSNSRSREETSTPIAAKSN